MDFVLDALAGGRWIKTLNIVCDFTKESVGIVLDHGISGHYVTRVLDQVTCFRGAGQVHGNEFDIQGQKMQRILKEITLIPILAIFAG